MIKLLSVIFSLTPLLAVGEDSYFFDYATKPRVAEKRIEGEVFRITMPIKKLTPPKASYIHAYHQGLGRGRAYQIQVDLAEQPAEDWFPLLKLGDEVIDQGISLNRTEGEAGTSFHVESDDPDKIRRWTRLHGELLKVPEDQIEIDLTKTEDKVDVSSKAAPLADQPKNWDGVAKWQLGQAGSLRLKMEGDSTLFLLNDEKEMFRLKYPEYVAEAILSDDGKSLALSVSSHRGGGGNRATLLRVRPVRGELKIERLLDSHMKLFKGRRWWISNLGAMSNDGTRLLARFGVEPPEGGRIPYRWYTVELASGKILGEGMSIENGKTSPDAGRESK